MTYHLPLFAALALGMAIGGCIAWEVRRMFIEGPSDDYEYGAGCHDDPGYVVSSTPAQGRADR